MLTVPLQSEDPATPTVPSVTTASHACPECQAFSLLGEQNLVAGGHGNT